MMAGKWHVGSKDPATWPSSRGFDESFSLLGGMASHWKATIPLLPSYPSRYAENGTRVNELPDDYYSTDFFTDRIIQSIEKTDQPFFAYLAFTAPHNPLHAPRDLIEKYKSTYAEGWDVLHDRRLASLISLGLVAEHVKRQPRPAWIPAWNSLEPDAKQTLTRDIAIYAAMIDRIDHSVGRLIERLHTLGKYDNTCFVVMSDNGPNKTTMADYLAMTGGSPEHLRKLNNSFNNRGLPRSSVDHGPGWAYGLAAPFRLMKGYQTQGGVLAPLIIKLPRSWKKASDRITSPVHVMDVMPTVLDLVDGRHPASESNDELLAMQGHSLLPLIESGQTVEFDRREFGGELFGLRAYRRGNWKILRLPPPYGNDRWQLYELTSDPGEMVDLAKRYPDRLEQLVAAYKTYVSANGVVSPNRQISYAMAPKNRSKNIDYRQIVLEGQSNFRDIGGYLTADGRSVGMGRLFRSGELPKLTDQAVSTLQEIGIKTVVNFLTAEEIGAHGPDRIPLGCHELSLPISSDDGMVGVVLQARKTADFSKVSAELNPEFHRTLVREAKVQYAELLRAIIRQKDPLVFHCSHGIHRTGTATAILLWSLGVPWETVRADYLLSNHYRQGEVLQRTDQLRKMAAQNQSIEPENVDMTNIDAFYTLQGSYIDAARDQILEDYRSIDGYLTRGLGLTDDEINQLRDRLLD